MDSPVFLHIQHQSIIITWLFLKLSKANIFLNAAVPTKIHYSRRSLIFPNALPRKGRASQRAKRLIKRFDLECTPSTRDPTHSILATSTQL
jgi:hypothetical protein